MLRVVAATLGVTVVAGCGEVHEPITDAGPTPDAAPVDCERFCGQATSCAWEEPATCCTDCHCFVDRLYRPQIASLYADCIVEGSCDATDPDACLSDAIAATPPTATGDAFQTSCANTAVRCPDLDCVAALPWNDAALGTIALCLNEVDCPDVIGCVEAARMDLCADVPAC